MRVYLDNAIERYSAEGRLKTRADLQAAVLEGAALRARPLAMTAAVILAGLVPILIGTRPARKRCSASPRPWSAAC